MSKVMVVIPNWNGAESLPSCIDSLKIQSCESDILVVDNGSIDDSLNLLQKYKNVKVIKHSTNKGYAGGVNPGFNFAIDNKYDYVAAFNNDAIADRNWLKKLVEHLDSHEETGIVTSKILNSDGTLIDSTGDYYTNWGLSYPRGRGEKEINKYDDDTEIFAASGGASLYRVKLLEEIGLLDEDFFAYYEDVDLSFRAQIAGWKVAYVPGAVVYHQIGATSGKLKGFTTYQTMKNLPVLLLKNVPRRYLYTVGWRFTLAHFLFFFKALSRGQGWIAFKGDFKGTYLLFTAFKKRRAIKRTKKVSDEYIWGMIVHDLPPDAKGLRKLRANWWKIIGKK